MRRLSLAFVLLFVAIPVCWGQATENKYLKWLNEDVPYIIEPSDKKAFLALKTDAEREQFIKEFWLRRDPDPDSEENEWRDEYYERIAYANAHFTFGNVAGWRADRGRVYILWGAATEKQTTSSGEIWKYKFVLGVGPNQVVEFVRAPGTADLRLKGGPLRSMNRKTTAFSQ